MGCDLGLENKTEHCYAAKRLSGNPAMNRLIRGFWRRRRSNRAMRCDFAPHRHWTPEMIHDFVRRQRLNRAMNPMIHDFVRHRH
jgi:hypothetical protein